MKCNMKLFDDDEVKAAAASRLDAIDGDFRRLAGRLREGAVLTAEERALAADYLDGKRKREAHRPESIRTKMKWWLVAKFVDAAVKESGWPDKAIVAEAIEHYGISRTDAYRILKEVKSPPSG